MGYQALLFCPDEKIARTVTQVLSELEFSVDACVEPFAAVKKLMGQHFDAVVVDCDNEQNATLLFKSARNSTSNQASLAVAVVEGQAGVAKAFRIGANLVLTKPINVEQAKGTLRVARGLLRKGEPGKAAAPGAAQAASTPAPTPSPAKTTPSAAARPSALPPRPMAPPTVKPAVSAAAQAKNPIDIKGEQIAVAPSASISPSASPTASPEKPALKLSGPSLSSGAASAPAPAREVPEVKIAEAPSPAVEITDAVIEEAAEAATSSPVLSSSSASAVPTFSFGGGSAEPESSGDRKKIFIGVAAVLVFAIGAFVAWGHFQAQKSQVVSSASSPAAAAPKPVSSAPAPAAATPAPAATAIPVPTAQPAAQPSAAAPAPNTAAPHSNATDNTEPAPDDGNSAATSAHPAPAPLVVKSGAAPKTQTKAAALDAAAPSMIGIATPGSGGLPNLVEGSSAPKPVLQTLNISQGVSQGLVVKRVQPAYPRNALSMRVEGTVQLMATISKSGDIGAVKVLSGPPQLTSAAVDAVKQWKYKPYLLNGEPVDIQTQVTVVFKLPR
jgi:protein TonB